MLWRWKLDWKCSLKMASFQWLIVKSFNDAGPVVVFMYNFEWDMNIIIKTFTTPHEIKFILSSFKIFGQIPTLYCHFIFLMSGRSWHVLSWLLFFNVLKCQYKCSFYFKNVEAVGLGPVNDLTEFAQSKWRYGKRCWCWSNEDVERGVDVDQMKTWR